MISATVRAANWYFNCLLGLGFGDMDGLGLWLSSEYLLVSGDRLG